MLSFKKKLRENFIERRCLFIYKHEVYKKAYIIFFYIGINENLIEREKKKNNYYITKNMHNIFIIYIHLHANNKQLAWSSLYDSFVINILSIFS